MNDRVPVNMGVNANYFHFVKTTYESTKVCDYCGKEFKTYNEQRQYIIQGKRSSKRRNFCSWTCKSKYKKEHKIMEYY